MIRFPDFKIAHVVAAILLGTTAIAATYSIAQATEKAAVAKKAEPAKPAAPQAAWQVRCEDAKPENKETKQPATPKMCEVFQRLTVEKTGQRVVEVAFGYPVDKKELNGVVILPLGILLEEETMMQVDNKDKIKLPIKFCAPGGCVSSQEINKGKIDALRKGKELKITGKASTGQALVITLTLDGLDTALKQIEK